MLIRNFFWFCAGVNRRLLLECENDFSKYFAIGATVFFTACFAAVSGAYALYFVFSGSSYAIGAAICFGILWGLTIFNIDRYLVISIKKENKPGKELLTALPRILLAIMIGIVIARPLELKIFDKEIKEGLKQYYLENQEQIVQTKNDKFNLQFKDITEQLDKKKNEKQIAYDNWENEKVLRDKERFGTKTEVTTGKAGWGTETKKLQLELEKKGKIYEALDTSVTELEKLLKNKRAAAGLNEVTFVNDAALDSLVSNAGFYDRNKILGQISGWTPWNFLENKKDTIKNDKKLDSIKVNKQPSVDNTKRLTIQQLDGENDKTVFFISMLLVLIECLPIFVKLMSKRGCYDMKLDEEEDRIQFLTRHETYANKHLIQQLALSQREVLTKAIEQWESNELNNENLGRRYVNPNDSPDE